MYGKTNALASYGKVANAETNSLQQVVMLYDGAIKFVRLSASDIEAGDLVAKAEHTDRALDIIGYMQSVLNFESGGDVAPVLDTLYQSVSRMILQASTTLNAVAMRQAADMLAPVRESWATIARSPSAVAAAASQPTTPSTQNTSTNIKQATRYQSSSL